MAEFAALDIEPEKACVSESRDSGRINGFGIYEMTADSVILHKISPENDLVLFDGIARSIMFLAVLKGIEKAVFKASTMDNAGKLRFVKDESGVLEPISEIFNGCDDCRHNKNN